MSDVIKTAACPTEHHVGIDARATSGPYYLYQRTGVCLQPVAGIFQHENRDGALSEAERLILDVDRDAKLVILQEVGTMKMGVVHHG